MVNKLKIFINFLLIQILINSIISTSSPRCTLKIACKNSCNFLKLKNGLNPAEEIEYDFSQ